MRGEKDAGDFLEFQLVENLIGDFILNLNDLKDMIRTLKSFKKVLSCQKMIFLFVNFRQTEEKSLDLAKT